MIRQITLCAAAGIGLAACAAPQHAVAERGDLLTERTGPQTLSQEMIAQANDPDGCLAPGNAGDRRSRCEDLRDLIAPPPPPPPVSVPNGRRDD